MNILFTEIAIRKKLPDKSAEIVYLLGDWEKRAKVSNLTKD